MAKTGKKAANSGLRLRKLTKKQSKTVAKKSSNKAAIPSSFNILKQSLMLIRKNWKVLGGITLVYVLLNIVLASGLSGAINSFSSVKETIGTNHNLSDALSSFGGLISGSAGGSESSSVLQSVLIIIESLVIIWALRQLLAGRKFSIKDAYYKSMTPLVPFLLVVFVIIIQLLPVSLGAAIVSLIVETVAPASGLVATIMGAIIAALIGWSLYMLSCSIFGLYIATLPDMQPRQALRSAKKLVAFRRLAIIRRLLFLPIFILATMAVLVLPLILFAHVLVVPVFYLLTILVLLFAHTYLYNLYRGLLDAQ